MAALSTVLWLEGVHQSCPDCPGVVCLAVICEAPSWVSHFDIQCVSGKEVSTTDEEPEVAVNPDLIDQIKFPADVCVIPQERSRGSLYILDRVAKGIPVFGGITNIKSLDREFIPGQ